MKRIRVVLADDHTLVRRGLSSLLSADGFISVVGEAKDGRDLTRKVNALQPDIALVDISMPLLNGLDAIPRIHRASPETRVIILSMFSDDAYIAQAWKHGAWGYVLKDEAPEQLIRAIRAVAAGKKSFPIDPAPIATHDPLVMEAADRVLTMNSGVLETQTEKSKSPVTRPAPTAAG